MFKSINQNKSKENKLYNKILLLSRNKFFYTQLLLNDTFQNRIYLIFLHVSFLFIKIKKNNDNIHCKKFYQNIFDIIFQKIELNMREVGCGDVTVNRSMKHLIKIFYAILLNAEEYVDNSFENKKKFLTKYLVFHSDKKTSNNNGLVAYFDKYRTFCLDLSLDNVLKGDINFTYK